MSDWTSRGTGKCPNINCSNVYRNAWKPKTCSSCGFEIGGSYIPKAKKAKLQNPDCVSLFEHHDGHVYSAKTSPKGDRCFVSYNKKAFMCHNEKCKQSRAITVSSHDSSVVDFSCPHIKTVENSETSQQQWHLIKESIENFPCDSLLKVELHKVLSLNSWPAVFQVATNVFVVNGPPTASSPLGYVHLWKIKEGVYRCTSSDCKSFGRSGLGKQQKSKKLCIHQHVMMCVLYESSKVLDKPSTSSPCSSTTTAPSLLPDQSPDPVSRAQNTTIQTNLSRSLPYPIPIRFMSKAREIDAATVLKLEKGGWPLEFLPHETLCKVCGFPLGKIKKHPGSRGSSYILTNSNPFLVCNIFVKSCSNKDCKLMHQVWPIEMGLFNVCDKILLSFEVLIEWREAFKRGVPISSAIESKLQAWCNSIDKDSQPPSSEIKYLCRLLYNAFYCFEMMSDRSFDDTICGICGIIGEFYLGDGNEKNCCTLKGVIYDNKDKEVSTPISLEEFVLKLKKIWVGKTTFSTLSDVDDKFTNASEVPPIIAPAMRAEVILNTEMEKKSVYLQLRKNPAPGDPALLHQAIKSKELDMNSLQSLPHAQLLEISKNCNIIIPSGASKSFIITEIHALYASLLVGNSPCHGFNKVPGNTGGFYHFVCRHGCTVASKFLLLQESVRDAADIYLSLRFPPPLFICDTPCGFARHLDVRNPEVTDKIWGDNVGCFEKPVIEKSPSQFSVPELVPLEYRESDVVLPNADKLDEWEHPITRNARRFVVGDRFHASTEPHKSPLCKFHDINHLQQAFAVKTSYQESENHRKNFLRLRSSTMQSFPVHYCYNYLMDFYHNEQIVSSQLIDMNKLLQPQESLARDMYKRFVKVKNNT